MLVTSLFVDGRAVAMPAQGESLVYVSECSVDESRACVWGGVGVAVGPGCLV